MENSTRPDVSSVEVTPVQRFLALLIDGFVAYVPMFILAFIPVVRNFAGLIVLAYYLVKDALPFGDGQSIGKKVIGIKVIKEDTGASIKGDYAASATRNASLFIPLYDALLVLGIVGPKDGKRLGDTWAKTKVVKA